MHVHIIPNWGSPPTVLLRESYREGAKVCKRTLANLSELTGAQIETIRGALRGEVLRPVAQTFEITRSRAHGQHYIALVQRVYDNVTLEEGVFCGPSMVFTNVYNPRSLIERKSEYRTTLVKKGATLGANCTIVCGTTTGEYAFVGAGAVVNKDVPAYALMVGVPARQIGWMSEFGEQIPLPLHGQGQYTCPHTGRAYVLQDDGLSVE